MPDIEEYLRHAEAAEAAAAKLPPGFEREELIRRAFAYREIAATLTGQAARSRSPE